MAKGRVLFLYCNKEGHYGIPNCLALLSACLKQNDYEVVCFDTTPFNCSPNTLLQREKHGGIQKVDYKDYWGNEEKKSKEEIPQLLNECIKNFNPHLIAITLTDVNYTFAKELIKNINIPIIVGGSTATLAPEKVIKDFSIVCVGEGEDTLVEFANCIVENKNYDNVKNLWIRKENEVIKNPLRPFKNLNELPTQDWTIFDKKHYYKPYMGNFYKTAFAELSRGCQYACSFCCNSKLREIVKDCGNYIRLRNVDNFIKEVQEMKEKYEIELIFLIDDNFLGKPLKQLKEFCEKYKQEINLPFYIQTRAETVSEEKVKLLKEAGISTIAIGIEHGDEEYRKKYMNRKVKNEVLEKAFAIVHKFEIRTTANIIIGMPYETEEMMRDTIQLMKKIKPKSYSINFYAPYLGTKMRMMAIEQNIITKDYMIENSNDPLEIPNFSKEKIRHYYENFKKYLDD